MPIRYEPGSGEDIELARRQLLGHVRETGFKPSPRLSDRVGHAVGLKLENQQLTGSFKIRGATCAILRLDAQQRQRGLVTASTGNHGRAVAYAARTQGVRAVVCMSRLVPANKVAAVRELGAEVHIVGASQDDAMQEVTRLVREEGLTLIPPFDHADVIAGQGTAGLEIADAMPDVATVLVPLSGGGLAAGVAAAVRFRHPHAEIVGVSMRRGAAMAASLQAGHPVEVREEETLADSLGGGVGLDNRYTFALCRALLDDVVLLDEDEIAAGIRHAFHDEGELVEGAGAVGIAALLAGKVRPKGPVAVLLSGANIDTDVHQSIVSAQAKRERDDGEENHG